MPRKKRIVHTLPTATVRKKRKRMSWLKYSAFLLTDVWWTIRQAAMERARWKCERCGNPAQEVHHITYDRLGGDELPDDLEALCKPCHRAHHGHGVTLKPKGKMRRRRAKDPNYGALLAAIPITVQTSPPAPETQAERWKRERMAAKMKG